MPLARAQRFRLANLLAWARTNGWRPDCYPHSWTKNGDEEYLRYDPAEQELTVSRRVSDPVRWRAAVVPVEDVDMAIDVLAALRFIPAKMSTLARSPGSGAEPANCLRWFEGKVHRDHRWERDDVWVHCSGWRPELPPGTEFDAPSSFKDAAHAFADLVEGQVDAHLTAAALSSLARSGQIISVAYFDEVVGGSAPIYDADRLTDAQDVGAER